MVSFSRFTTLLSLIIAPALSQDIYDYIVVGSGPGGGPLASNLARANYSVLLLEAGDLSTQGNDSLQYPPQITWDFFVKHYEDETKNRMNRHLTWKTKEGRYWVGAGDSEPPAGSEYLGVYYPRGSSVGGSSMINAMCTWLPPDSDWNYIQNLTGEASWSAQNMRRIFERIEKAHYLPRGTPGHGFDGYFETNMSPATSLSQPMLSIVQAEAQNLSSSTAERDILARMASDANYLDPKRDLTTGIFGLPFHQKANGDRYSSRDYIQSTLDAHFPLTLRTNSLATKVLFSNTTTTTTNTTCGTKPRATGIQYLRGKSLYKADARFSPSSSSNTTLHTALARKEVILAGGTFNTPQLLLLSGLGPRSHLASLSIPLIAHLPGVGANLQDNQELPIIGRFNTSSPDVTFTQAFLMRRTPFAPDAERDMFIMQGTRFAFRGFWPSNQTNPALPVDPPGTYGISMVKAKPQNAKGYVRLKTADPQDVPSINFNLYAEGAATDRGAIKDTIAWARSILSSASAAANTSITPVEPPCPAGPDAQGSCGAADDEWITGQTFGHHPTSTAAIGADGDEMAVLDGRFRVRGVRGLRVVDASVFPRTPGIFPVVSTFMVSELASGMVREDDVGVVEGGCGLV